MTHRIRVIIDNRVYLSEHEYPEDHNPVPAAFDQMFRLVRTSVGKSPMRISDFTGFSIKNGGYMLVVPANITTLDVELI